MNNEYATLAEDFQMLNVKEDQEMQSNLMKNQEENAE